MSEPAGQDGEPFEAQPPPDYTIDEPQDPDVEDPDEED